MDEYFYSAPSPEEPPYVERTFELFIPHKALTIPPGKLYNSIVWVGAIRRKECYLHALLMPIMVESICTKTGENGLIIRADTYRSTYFLSPTDAEGNSKYKVTDLVENPVNSVLLELTEPLAVAFREVVSSAARSSFVIQIPASFPPIPTNILAAQCKVHYVFQTAKRLFSVAELTRSARNPDLDEYRFFTEQFFIHDQSIDSDQLGILLDGLTLDEPQQPRVDADLRVINPNSIKSRKFVSSGADGGHGNLEATERAEERHQSMLQDIASYFDDLGAIPCESNSVDLAVRIADRLLIFELKSANRSNFFRQCDHALAQLMHYGFEFSRLGQNVSRSLLIIERCVGNTAEWLLVDFFKHCNLGVFFYDKTKDWPCRLYHPAESIESLLFNRNE